jgi:arginase
MRETERRTVIVFVVPYDSGRREVRMGRGPGALLSGGLEGALRAPGREIGIDAIEATGSFQAENATAFELMRLVSDRVREAAGSGVFDGHADLNTPHTSRSAFLDGMGLAIIVGDCWEAMAGTIPGFKPILEENVVLVGARDFGAEERERLARSGVTVVEPESVRREGAVEALGGPLDALRARVSKVYVHLDLDVLDPGLVAPANGFAPPDGFAVDEVALAIREVAGRVTIAAAGIASYDPSSDEGGRVSRAGIALARELAGGVDLPRLR